MSRTRQRYCRDHAHLYTAKARHGYSFGFRPDDYPDVFGEPMLQWCRKVGPYGQGNPGGWTRDHKVSVNEAIRRGLDPFYIRHPLNCELMPHSANSTKRARSSMSYEDLVAQIDAYEATHRAPPA